jgi:hypothetical protein
MVMSPGTTSSPAQKKLKSKSANPKGSPITSYAAAYTTATSSSSSLSASSVFASKGGTASTKAAGSIKNAFAASAVVAGTKKAAGAAVGKKPVNVEKKARGAAKSL